jgi:hypothetical protein
MGGQAPLILVGAGHLEEVKERPPGTTVDFTVRALPQTYSDTNRDFNADTGEARKNWELAAAVKRKIDLQKPAEMAKKEEPKKDEAKKDEPKKDEAKKEEPKKDEAKKDEAKKDDKAKDKKPAGSDEMRAVVVADSDALSDGVLAAYGNRYLLFDAVRWLSGDESIAGEVSSETDVPIAHTRKQDLVWFYACIFLVPLLVLGAGFLMTGRRRMGTRMETSGDSGNKEAA